MIQSCYSVAVHELAYAVAALNVGYNKMDSIPLSSVCKSQVG